MFVSRVAVLGLIAVSLALPAAAREPVRLAPLGKWNLHYAENSCQLMRQFGDAAKPLSLVIERVNIGSGFSLLVIGGPLRARVGYGTPTVAFTPLPADPTFVGAGTIAETVSKKETALFWSVLRLVPAVNLTTMPKASERPVRDLAVEAEAEALEKANAASVTGLDISEPGGRRFFLTTGALDKAFLLMRECGRAKLADAEVDLAVHDRIVRPAFAKQSLALLFRDSDYPSPAVFERSESVVTARLNIGADGTVTRCTSLTRFKDPSFAKVVCRNLSKARFLPAELVDGTAVPDMVVTSVRFVMPD